MIPEHAQEPSLSSLFKQEVEICLYLWDNARDSALKAGRELLRLLPAISQVPELAKIVRSFSETDSQGLSLAESLSMLPQVETGHIKVMIPLWLENKIQFLFSNVTSECFPIYIKWLNETVSQDINVFADIIRFLVVNLHPSNEDLNSNKVKRWEMIGFLIESAETKVQISQLMFNILFDFFSFKNQD